MPDAPNPPDAALALLATLHAAQRRIEHLAHQHLPLDRAIALEYQRRYTADSQREILRTIGGILDREINIWRRGFATRAAHNPQRVYSPPPRPPQPSHLRQLPPSLKQQLHEEEELPQTLNIPVEADPVEADPVEDHTVEDHTVEETPAEETPVEHSLIEEAPVEDDTVEDDTVEDDTVEDASVEDVSLVIEDESPAVEDGSAEDVSLVIEDEEPPLIAEVEIEDEGEAPLVAEVEIEDEDEASLVTEDEETPFVTEGEVLPVMDGDALVSFSDDSEEDEDGPLVEFEDITDQPTHQPEEDVTDQPTAQDERLPERFDDDVTLTDADQTPPMDGDEDSLLVTFGEDDDLVTDEDDMDEEDDFDRMVLAELERVQAEEDAAVPEDDEDTNLNNVLVDDDSQEDALILVHEDEDPVRAMLTDDDDNIYVDFGDPEEPLEVPEDDGQPDLRMPLAQMDNLVIEDDDDDDFDELVLDIGGDGDEESTLLASNAEILEALVAEDLEAEPPGDTEEVPRRASLPIPPRARPYQPPDEDGDEESTVMATAAQIQAAIRKHQSPHEASEGDEEAPVEAISPDLAWSSPGETERLDDDDEDAPNFQPGAAAVQLIGGGRARTLGHTLELEAADPSDEEIPDYSDGSGNLSVTLEVDEEEDYEEAPIPQLTDSAEPVLVSEPVINAIPEPSEDEIKKRLKEAIRAEQDGLLQQAIVLYSDVIDMDPLNANARMGRGRSLTEMADYAAAMSDFQKAEDLNPQSPAPSFEMGNLFYARKDYRRAITFYSQALKIDEDHALALVRRGMSHYYRRAYDDALGDLKRARELDSSIPGLTSSINKINKAKSKKR